MEVVQGFEVICDTGSASNVLFFVKIQHADDDNGNNYNNINNSTCMVITIANDNIFDSRNIWFCDRL
jgi:hypothetical protein